MLALATVCAAHSGVVGPGPGEHFPRHTCHSSRNETLHCFDLAGMQNMRVYDAVSDVTGVSFGQALGCGVTLCGECAAKDDQQYTVCFHCSKAGGLIPHTSQGFQLNFQVRSA